MSDGMLVLLGTIVGAAAATISGIVAARITARTERSRIAVEAGFREWENMRDHAKDLAAHGKKVRTFPPLLFVFFNEQLLRALHSRRGLTSDRYGEILQRQSELRALIEAQSERRRKEDKAPWPGEQEDGNG